jgi:nucleoside-diphosphate-sugar epimerase
LIDQAKGEHDNHTTYDDTNIEQLKSIPESAIHHVVDLAVLAADEEGYVRTYIVLPSTIYGLADGPVFKAGLANPISQQVPQLIRGGLGRGRAGTIGKGKNVWPHVHINDIANLFATIFNALQGETERVGHGWEGFYFGENGHYNFGELGHAIGKYLVKIEKATEETPVPFTKEEIDKYFNGVSSATAMVLYILVELSLMGFVCRASTWGPTLGVWLLADVSWAGGRGTRRRTSMPTSQLRRITFWHTRSR